MNRTKEVVCICKDCTFEEAELNAWRWLQTFGILPEIRQPTPEEKQKFSNVSDNDHILVSLRD